MSEVSITDQVAWAAKTPVIWCPFLVGGNAALQLEPDKNKCVIFPNQIHVPSEWAPEGVHEP